MCVLHTANETLHLGRTYRKHILSKNGVYDIEQMLSCVIVVSTLSWDDKEKKIFSIENSVFRYQTHTYKVHQSKKNPCANVGTKKNLEKKEEKKNSTK